MTTYLPKHPGGRWIVLNYAGTDASAGFHNTIHSPVAIETMAEFYIGTLKQED